ncbi:tyrosine-type recombinase/integrase [Actinoplanes sp. NPDC051346]|uniref:tyrosine-type recombinase/integrase n=1 Tax=Actinoplanes sp. NPDC051346 TaxID=3155048 RepID=UPI003441FE82
MAAAMRKRLLTYFTMSSPASSRPPQRRSTALTVGQDIKINKSFGDHLESRQGWSELAGCRSHGCHLIRHLAEQTHVAPPPSARSGRSGRRPVVRGPNHHSKVVAEHQRFCFDRRARTPGPRIFEACRSNVGDLGEEHGHRVLKVRGKGSKTVLIPLPPAVARAIDRAVDDREAGPILRNAHGLRMDRHAASRRLRHLADAAGIRMPRMHPHMLRHTFLTTMLDAGVSLRDVQIAARHADPRTTMRYDRPRKNLDRHPQYILAAYMASGT